MRLVQLSRHSIAFPSPEGALREPNGLLALGGDLSPARLLMAYQRGIFPWFSPGDPILWWSPDPRAVLWPESLHISRSMKRFHKRSPYRVTMNYAFGQVIEGCASDREEGTWITRGVVEAYHRLHELGHAHSIEVWREDELVGGMYGVAQGITSLVGALFGFGFGTSVLYCGIGLVVFMLLTAYDTQKLRQIYAYYAGDAELAEKASIYGALTLYLDFINIFLYVVRLLGMNSRSRNN